VTHAYSAQKTNVCVAEVASSVQALAVVAGISVDKGLETFHIEPRSINSQSFISFMHSLLDINSGQELAIFLDNCTVHHSKLVSSFVKENDITLIFNVPYSPQYNPIEHYWGLVKNSYKRQKL
jgi:transposase